MSDKTSAAAVAARELLELLTPEDRAGLLAWLQARRMAELRAHHARVNPDGEDREGYRPDEDPASLIQDRQTGDGRP